MPDTSRPVGRPLAMTEKVVNKLEEAFLLGCSDIEACLFAGISKQTLYNYQKDHPEFIDRKEELKENPILIARTSVIKGIKEDSNLALKFLERKSDEFKPSSKTDVTSNGATIQGNTIVLTDFEDETEGK